MRTQKQAANGHENDCAGTGKYLHIQALVGPITASRGHVTQRGTEAADLHALQ